MSAWILIAIVACSPAPCTEGYAIGAYRASEQCNAALRQYAVEMISDRKMACVELDRGTMEVLRSMR